MVRCIYTDGLKDVSSIARESIPMYLTDDWRVIEGPTHWALDKATVGSKSDPTMNSYGNIVGNYLQWLDDEEYGAENWQYVDQDDLKAYIVNLVENRDENGAPNNDSINYYIGRIADLYRFGKNHHFPHYLDLPEQFVQVTLSDQRLLGHINATITVPKLPFKLPTGRPTYWRAEIDKFVDERSFPEACLLFEDKVFAVIASVIWSTGMRPKDLLGLPYRGKGMNHGFNPDAVDCDADIYYAFESKGKNRNLYFPAELWRKICAYWIPLRRERAELYYARNGLYPPNTALFLNCRGDPVEYHMIWKAFNQVQKHPGYPRRRFSAKMLRHSFATYFVYRALKAAGRLGKGYLYDAALDEELRHWMGHEDIGTTLEYYVHLVNRFVHDDLLADLRNKVPVGIFESLQSDA